MPVKNNFKFVNFRVTQLNYTQNQAFKDNSVSKGIELSPDFNVTYKKNDSTLFVDLSISFENPKAPFFLHVILSGLFELKYQPSDEELDKLAHINLAAILFPFLRQVVADMTTKAGFAPLLLPPINFSKAYQNTQKKKAISQESKGKIGS
ncbi:MAG: protein-export chaperone SecB [Desulfobacteraceae bacterium]